MSAAVSLPRWPAIDRAGGAVPLRVSIQDARRLGGQERRGFQGFSTASDAGVEPPVRVGWSVDRFQGGCEHGAASSWRLRTPATGRGVEPASGSCGSVPLLRVVENLDLAGVEVVARGNDLQLALVRELRQDRGAGAIWCAMARAFARTASSSLTPVSPAGGPAPPSRCCRCAGRCRCSRSRRAASGQLPARTRPTARTRAAPRSRSAPRTRSSRTRPGPGTAATRRRR